MRREIEGLRLSIAIYKGSLKKGNNMEYAVIVAIIAIVYFFFAKEKMAESHRNEINALKKEIDRINREHSQELHRFALQRTEKINELEAAYKEQLSNQAKRLCERVNRTEEENERIWAQNEKLLQAFNKLESNLTSIPYMAGMIADIETYGLEKLAVGLDWGSSVERLKKVKSIREIRRDAQAMVEKNKESQYQLAYLLELFPALSDIIEADYNNLPVVEVDALSEYDTTRDYLSKEEYSSLSVTERNQLALDRYMNSHNKTKWQIGRDYEQYVGHQYRKRGYEVDDFGSYMGLEDLGRDIIAKRDGTTLIIQCKYWSSIKEIHEKHVTQLYGTVASYCIENNVNPKQVKGVLVTNIELSEMAKKMAEYLGISYKENYEMGAYPCIKCNIGHDEYGETRIYHLPFDQQYDLTKIKKKGEFYATTVAEAEHAGFRRTYKWFGNK